MGSLMLIYTDSDWQRAIRALQREPASIAGHVI